MCCLLTPHTRCCLHLQPWAARPGSATCPKHSPPSTNTTRRNRPWRCVPTSFFATSYLPFELFFFFFFSFFFFSNILRCGLFPPPLRSAIDPPDDGRSPGSDRRQGNHLPEDRPLADHRQSQVRPFPLLSSFMHSSLRSVSAVLSSQLCTRHTSRCFIRCCSCAYL